MRDSIFSSVPASLAPRLRGAMLAGASALCALLFLFPSAAFADSMSVGGRRGGTWYGTLPSTYSSSLFDFTFSTSFSASIAGYTAPYSPYSSWLLSYNSAIKSTDLARSVQWFVTGSGYSPIAYAGDEITVVVPSGPVAVTSSQTVSGDRNNGITPSTASFHHLVLVYSDGSQSVHSGNSLVFDLQKDLNAVVVVMSCSITAPSSSTAITYSVAFSGSFDVIRSWDGSGTREEIQNLQQQQQQQHEELISTEGSETVVDDVLDGVTEDSILDRLGFVGTVISVPLAIFEGLSSSEDATFDFPGFSIDVGNGVAFSLPAQTVDLWSYLPVLETPCRFIVTLTFVIAWMRGVKSLYDRIFHGEQEVTVVSEDGI